MVKKGLKNTKTITQTLGESKAKGTENNQEFRRVDIIISHKNKLPKGLKNIQKEPQTFTVSPDKNIKIISKSGTQFSIEPNSFVDKKGNEITGKITVKINEYRDVTDFIIGGIPMDFHGNGEHGLFNSAGMFDISAQANGKQIYLKKGANIDVNFQLTQNIPNLNPYNFDTNNGHWNTLSPITFNTGSRGNSWRNTLNCYDCQPYVSSINKGQKIAKHKLRISEIIALRQLKEDTLNTVQIRRNTLYEIGRKQNLKIDSIHKLIDKNRTQYKIEIIKQKKKYSTFKIIMENDPNSALNNFRNVVWKTNKTEGINDTTLWYNFNIDKEGNNEKINLTFSNIGSKRLNISASPNYKEKIKRRAYNQYNSTKVDQFYVDLNSIDDSITLAKNTQSEPFEKRKKAATKNLNKLQKHENELHTFINQFQQEHLNCIYENGKLLGKKEELYMTKQQWFTHFDSTKTIMTTRYDSLIKE